jgi:hypothetical protein
VTRSGLRLRFVGDVDERLKQSVMAFARWLRQWYLFSAALEIKLVHVDCFVDEDGGSSVVRWWHARGPGQPGTAELAVASIGEMLDTEDASAVHAMVFVAIGRLVKNYFQALHEAPIREDYAEIWATKLLNAYASGATPPQPYRGSLLEDA